MKKIIFYFLVLLSINNIYSQDGNKGIIKEKYKGLLNCEHLKSMLKNDTAISLFFLGKSNSKIIFIDPWYLFDCDSLTVNNQEVIFLHEYSPKFFKGMMSVELLVVKSDRYITTFMFKKDKKEYKITLWCLNNNANITFNIYPKKKKNYIKITGYGNF